MNDLINPFAPLPYGKSLFNLKENKAQIEAILDKVPNTFDSQAKQRHHLAGIGSCGGCAIKAAVDVLRDKAGKIMWFIMDIPSLGFGSMQNRNSPVIYNGEKQKVLFNPDEKNMIYNDLSEVCLASKIAVDIFACAQTDIDLVTLFPISSKLGGEIYYYYQFNSAEYGEKLHFDLFRNMTRYTVYDVSMKARCSVGLSIVKYLGGFGEITDQPVQLSVMDADKTIGFTMKQDLKLKPDSTAFIQFAVLFTTITGERRIRVLNYTLHVTEQNSKAFICLKFYLFLIDQMYLGTDCCAILNLEAKRKIRSIVNSGVKVAREELCHNCINLLAHYRKTVSVNSGTSQFVLPETMKVFPIMMLSLLKTPTFALSEDVKLDCKVANIAQLSSCSLSYFWTKIYPRLFSVSAIIKSDTSFGKFLENPSDGTLTNIVVKPNNIPASIEKIAQNDITILSNSEYIYIYLPDSVSDEIVEQVIYFLIFEYRYLEKLISLN